LTGYFQFHDKEDSVPFYCVTILLKVIDQIFILPNA
jgi:hypothetical protein